MTESVLSTAGAIPVKNEKGQVYMQKVKVHRYIAGKRPDFASDSEESGLSEYEAEDTRQRRINSALAEENRESLSVIEQAPTTEELNDPRFRRLMQTRPAIVDEGADCEEDRIMRLRRFRGEGDTASDEDAPKGAGDEDEDGEDENVDEEELIRRREAVRERAKRRRAAEEAELAATAAENEREADGAMEDDYEEEEEEYTSSSSDDEDEIGGGAPKLKPVFVRKSERITLHAKQRADALAAEAAAETQRLADERRRETLRLLEDEIRREAEEARLMQDELDALDSGDEDPTSDKQAEEYELWKVRELKRIRRDREAREAAAREQAEVERIRALSEAERAAEFRRNPREITNQAAKGKYRFLQKYYHRGAFFVQTDEEKLYQRDFTAPTLEDHFDKTKLPEVLRVKNFGRAGRTKYTHLVDQDTTAFDAAWTSNDPLATKFQMAHGGGFKEVFEKPTASRRRKHNDGK